MISTLSSIIIQSKLMYLIVLNLCSMIMIIIIAADYIVVFTLITSETFDHVIIQESEHL